jgi:hypothetical protein
MNSTDKKHEEARARLFQLVDEIQQRNADVPFEVIEREVAEAVAEVRAAEARRLRKRSRRRRTTGETSS